MDVAHPGEIHVFVLLGDKFNPAIFNGFNCWAGHFLGVDVPLVGKHGLDNHAATVSVGDGHVVFFDAFEITESIHVGDDFSARGKAFHTAILFGQGGVHLIVVAAIAFYAFGGLTNIGVHGKYIDHGQFVALANFVIIEVVGWCDFYAAGAFFHIGVFVGNDGNQSAYQGQNYVLAN